MMERLRQWAKAVKRDTVSLYLAARDPRTPWYAKVFAAAVVAYALSPLDLIPDFIPVIGYLDDILLVPLGLWIAMRLIPREVIEDCRNRAENLDERPTSRAAAIAVVSVWIAAAVMTGWIVSKAAAS
jgi:uncharacterized membrane protein YkvA (DUF1232 family)